MTPDPVYLTTRQIADVLDFKSTEAVVLLIEQGMLPCARIRTSKTGRRRYRPTVDELVSYLDVYDPAMLARVRATWPA